STGYNGTPRGTPHCIDDPCPGSEEPSGEGLSKCLSAHAEINALLQCPDVMDVWRCYSTTKPCFECVKALMNTSCFEIVFTQPYPHTYATNDLRLRPYDSQFLQNIRIVIKEQRNG
ncbi:MAG: hypothetical protein ACXADB_14095, partial [Candidatus Hermodarchaeia archaeon]